jgi:hypothetical protein
VIVEQEANRSLKDIEEREVEVYKSWAEIMSEEDVPSQAMRKLSVEEKTETTTPSKFRWRTPAPQPIDEMDSDSDDLAFQTALARQKRTVTREVACVREMLDEDERRQAYRKEKAKRTEDKLNDALWFVAQEAKKAAKKGGVDDDQSSPK